MKFLFNLLFCAVVVVAAVNGDEVDPRLEEYLEAHKECQKSTNTDKEEISKIFTGGPINAEILGPHVFCVHKKLNVQSDNGDIIPEGIRNVLEIFKPQKGQIDLVIKNCTPKKEGDTPEKASVELLLCAGKYVEIKIPENLNPFL